MTDQSKSAPVQAQPASNDLLKTLEDVTKFAERQICTHEETHRGGAIWEICDQCGAKWADDEGGKPMFKWPTEIEKARAALAATQPAVAPAAKPIPFDAINKVLTEVMDLAVENGANSISMPDEYVAVADFLCHPHEFGVNAAPVPAQGEREAIPTWREHYEALCKITTTPPNDLIAERRKSACRDREICELRATLAAKVQPVASYGYVARAKDGHETYFKGDASTSVFHSEPWTNAGMKVVPLYTHPAAAPSQQAQAGEDAPAWISVDERLPELHTTVALLDERRWMNTGSDDHNVNWHGAGYLCEVGQKYWTVFGEMRAQCLDAVTHWMLLPSAPQQPDGAGGV